MEPAIKCGEVHARGRTAYAHVGDRVKAIAAGFQIYIAKPVEPIELITMVAGARSLWIKIRPASEQ